MVVNIKEKDLSQENKEIYENLKQLKKEWYEERSNGR